ncbi:PREDICTED: protein phosphatase 1 regulatory subunit 12A [Nicrophorus vespilloides]|uniref:Protein phosphatase 1 regulatory subunit 12A n=1 Tax=Nicrophorus vespilloides TaxID=110193 RepID=A0ABM1MZR5_NICVS|nr:PREDICTED: protein phosphatase 1 regulatory subunit 12A [Nicrophorus vespilloides]
MSLETRSSTALFKRAEQLRRWEESETNREVPKDRQPKSRKIKFSLGCVFLAACAAGEKEDVLNLLDKGADINTANVDGLTALHQACIDDNLDMVEFLVEYGADVNRGDNEGWTPLHATVSCGFVSIAKYLIEKGANVAAVNCDGDLAIDVADIEQMKKLIQSEIDEQGIDPEEARNEEKSLMLKDAEQWLANKSSLVDDPNPKTGATPLHVAAAKGYLDVIKIVLQCGADVDKQDVDGWTPLHAAAHWGQREAAQILVENHTDMEAKNYVAFDVADGDMYKFLEELKQKQNKEEVMNRRQAKMKLEVLDKNADNETPSKVKKVELEIEGEKIHADIGTMEVSSESETDSESSDESSETESEDDSDVKKNRANAMYGVISRTPKVAEKDASPTSTPSPPKVDVTAEDNKIWRVPTIQKDSTPIKSSNSFKSKDANNENEVVLRRANSFQNDPAFYARYRELRARIQATSYPNYITNSYIIPPSPNKRQVRSSKEESPVEVVSPPPPPPNEANNVTVSSPASSPQPNSQPVRSGAKSPINSVQDQQSSTNGVATPTATPANNRLTMIKNFFKSFVPPVRDEESETQRKAHAKRVRETRRSTQGVTLEEIKSAEQFVKNKNQTTVNNNNNEQQQPNGANNGVIVSATITTAAPTVPTRDASAVSVSVAEATEPPSAAPVVAAVVTIPTQPPPPPAHERRPSWRLQVDNGNKFKLEDANKVSEAPSTPSFIRRPASTGASATRPASATLDTAETTVTLPLRRPKSLDEKEQDKENDVRNAQATLATQAAIQRRRRPKRRSTGVVAFDDVETEKDSSGGGDFDDNAKQQNHQESGNDRSSSRASRIGSSNDLILRGENGEIDYKKLYEQAIVDNDRLKDKLRKSDEDLKETKQTLEKLTTVTSKNSLSELEKRERRAMERKLSEMEEELKQLQKLKAENERLRAENRALTRVVSKLSNSAAK